MSASLAAIPIFRQALDPKAEAKALDRLAKDPMLNRQMEAYKTAVAKAKDLDSALKDPRVLQVLLPAMGLGDQVDNIGLAQKALTSDPADESSLVNRLPDTRWKDVATSLDLKNKGLDALRDASLIETLDKGIRELSWRNGLDESAAGISDALYFQENAKSATSAYHVLGNAVLRRVVTGALGLPPEFALQPVETQAKVIERRLDLKDLQNPKEVQKIAERYLIMTNMSSVPSISLPGFDQTGQAGLNLGAIAGINLIL